MAKRGYNQVLLEIFKTSRVLGWFPFDIKFRICEKSMSYCFLVGFVMFIIQRSLRLQFPKEGNHPVIILFNGSSVACTVLSYIVPVFWWIRRRRTVYKLIKSMNELINKCPNVRFKRNRPRYINLLVTPLFIFSCYSCKSSKTWYNALRYFRPYVSFFYGVSIICQFLEVLHLLQYIVRHDNKFDEADRSAIFKCFMILQQIDSSVYNPSIFLLITQNFIQIILYIFIGLLTDPHNSEFMKPGIVFDLIHSIIPLFIITCSYELVKAQSQQLKEKLIKNVIEGGYCRCLRKEGLEVFINDGDILSGCGFFTLDNSLVIALTLSAIIIAQQYFHPEDIASCFINYLYSVLY